MMPRHSAPRRLAGFTFVELLLALALGALVVTILGVLLRGLFGPPAACPVRWRRLVPALRQMNREIACAFAPPVEKLAPLELTTSTEPDKPQVALSFYAPVPAPLEYDLAHITYEVVRAGGDRFALRRLAAPCSGPYTNAPVTNLLYAGRFALEIAVFTNDTPHTAWPLPQDKEQPALPKSVRLTLTLPGQPPLATETLIQTMLPVRGPHASQEPKAGD